MKLNRMIEIITILLNKKTVTAAELGLVYHSGQFTVILIYSPPQACRFTQPKV